MAANFTNWSAAIAGCFAAAADRLPRGSDAMALGEFVLTVMEGGIMQARAAGHLAPFDSSVAQLRAYIDMLTARAAGEQGNS